ncbi:acyltransferase [Mycobacterium sp. Y57]|uniref:acyltransferase family protein n=1 Tax=Mycolicibacterium xanthum TaxID=2796469 RepID=UPI001C84BB15|nr:acyltransferase [Mycolicibacterium xanthum]MBX7431131.1 acyltransferase [Mycolicibacterium xanthum]
MVAGAGYPDSAQAGGPPGRRAGKDPAIETLRGVAIVLVVIGHVIGIDADRGMQAALDSPWRIFYLALVDVRLPLFTMISGYIYALRPLTSPDGLAGLLKTKSRRLLLPLLTVGTLLFVTQRAVPGTNYKPHLDEYYRIFIYPYEHLWFLQSIFVIFVLVGLLDAFGLLNTACRALVALAVSLAMFEVIPVPQYADIFSASGVLRLLPFFLLGYMLNRYWPRGVSCARLAAMVASPSASICYTRSELRPPGFC